MGETTKRDEKMNSSEREARSARDHDAELRDWAFKRVGNATHAFGRVFGDRKGRWPEGFAIATSPVQAGAQEEGSVIRTRNSRYLLAGPPGNFGDLFRHAEQQKANAYRRASVADDARLFDLLPAAWGMDSATFEKVAGLPQGWLWQWRNHYRAPSDAELARVRRLAGFHDAIRIVTYGEPDYPSWWRRRWTKESFIGERSPLEAVLQDQDMMDRLEQYLRSQMW